MSRVLMIYGTSYGQTEKIARRIGAALEASGVTVESCDAAKSRPSMDLQQYSAVVVGSSLIARGAQKSIQQFVSANVGVLNRVPTAYFQVSASAGSASQEGRNAAWRALEGFLKHAQWTPKLTASLAGAINYTKYPFLLRWYMKRAAAKNGGSTDTSRDHELTDWKQVDQLATDIASLVKAPVPEAAPEPALRG